MQKKYIVLDVTQRTYNNNVFSQLFQLYQCTCVFQAVIWRSWCLLQMFEIIRGSEAASHWPTVEAALFVMSSVARHIEAYVDYVTLRADSME